MSFILFLFYIYILTVSKDKLHFDQIERSEGLPASEKRVETSTIIRGDVQALNPSSSFVQETFWSELALWSGYNHPIPLWKTLLGPLQIARSPIVLWTSIVFMTAITWIVILTIGASQIFAAPPYSFSVAAVGNTFLSPFLASIVGTVVAKSMIDGAVKFLAKRNNGIFGKCVLIQ